MRNLILYFSRKGENFCSGEVRQLEKGNTQIVAEYIQKAVGGDLFEIERAEEYPADYHQCVEEAVKEWKSNARPELKRYLEDIGEYENVFVCGPCWCGTFPMAVFSQLERLTWNGKKVMAVMTHEGSGLGVCEQALKEICIGASFGEGLTVHGSEVADAEERVASWAKEMTELR